MKKPLVSVPAPGSTKPGAPSGKSKRTGSLSLFMRKVYNLANLRLETLCNSMQVNNKFEFFYSTFQLVLNKLDRFSKIMIFLLAFLFQ